jgi:ribosome-binding protein aMBF1 (putative translation factor)
MNYIIFHCECCGVFAKTTIQTIGDATMILCDECYKNLDSIDIDPINCVLVKE